MNDRQDVETILDRFREWLEAARDEAEDLDRSGRANGPGADGPGPEFGIIDLVEEFTALRHELKLQTKSGRTLLEQTEATVAALRQAIEQFRSVEPKEAQAVWAAGKPLAEALADLDESLDRGRREIEKARDRIAEETVGALQAALDERFRRRSWLGRRIAGGYHREVLEAVEDTGRARLEALDSLLEGYGLIQNRLRRVMKSERVERIDSEGRPVDPERMTVLEVVDDPTRPPGTVVKDLRRGYTWRGRLLRYAEVQAVSASRPAPTVLDRPTEPDEGLDGDETDFDIEIETTANTGPSRPELD